MNKPKDQVNMLDMLKRVINKILQMVQYHAIDIIANSA